MPRKKAVLPDRDDPARLEQLLVAFIEKHDRLAAKAERTANPILVATLCELADTDVRFVVAPWRRKANADGQLETALRCDAVAIARSSVRDQAVAKELRRVPRRARIRATGRYLYPSARARDLLAWLQEQPASAARTTLLRPLRRAVTRGHAFSMMFDTL